MKVGESSSSQKKAKKPKLSVAKKARNKKKQDYVDSDDDFVSETPGPSRSNLKPSSKGNKCTEQDIKRKKHREAQARYLAKQTALKKDQMKVTDALRKKTKRANETAEQQQERKRVDAERHAAMRAVETTNQQQERKRVDADRHAAIRAAESAEQQQERNRVDAVRHAAMRAAETVEQQQERNRIDAERHAAMRAQMTPEEETIERSAARERMAAARKYTSAKYKDATNSRDILQGAFKVSKLEETVDSIGTMTFKCNFCGALKFKGEKSRTTSCCSEGKVNLPPFPKPPEALMNLWMGTDTKSRLFKLHAR